MDHKRILSNVPNGASQLERWWRICLPMQGMQEMWVQFLGWKDHLEEEMETHSSILPGKSNGERGLKGYIQSVGSQKVTEHACTHQMYMEELITILLILLKLFQKTEQEGGNIPKKHSMKSPLSWYWNQTKISPKKRKLQVNIYDDYSCKYSQDIIKLQTGRK